MNDLIKKMKSKQRMLLLIGIIVVVVASLMPIVLSWNAKSKEAQKEIITKSTLEKMIHVSELSTYESVYNGVAKVMDKKNPEKVIYYVSYDAKVKAGIDFEQIKIDVDNEAKKIVVTIPEVNIMESNVDIASLDFIFYDKKANTETVSQEAYAACEEDVANESVNKNAIYDIAEQNAKNIIEALISPFVKQLDSEYTLDIN